jgi:prevent-host-death family protein
VHKTITAEDFEKRCLELLDEVAETCCEYVITKQGKPVAKLIPIGSRVRD